MWPQHIRALGDLAPPQFHQPRAKRRRQFIVVDIQRTFIRWLIRQV